MRAFICKKRFPFKGFIPLKFSFMNLHTVLGAGLCFLLRHPEPLCQINSLEIAACEIRLILNGYFFFDGSVIDL